MLSLPERAEFADEILAYIFEDLVPSDIAYEIAAELREGLDRLIALCQDEEEIHEEEVTEDV